eukprot:TRINITY_DN4407_c0_g1_i4.p1 TRINITY_DN4407_c0_g1~~TRINITY_DN4407_c0_g1_i4.p1  ORF type:complete len:274 (-),score=16.40 TRINITY_DN4407_c0_g1_i4:5-826(-)
MAAAYIQCKLPKASVFYYRKTTDDPQLDKIREVVSAIDKSSDTPVFLFFDQVVNSALANRISEDFGTENHVWVVLVSSSNLSHFNEIRGGAQDPVGKRRIQCSFSSRRDDCEAFLRLLLSDESIKLNHFYPATHADFSTLKMKVPSATDYDNICQWTNGHLLSIALLAHPTDALSCQDLLVSTSKVMAASFNPESRDSNLRFFIRLAQMFKNESSSVIGDVDYRFMIPTGSTHSVASPLYLQGFEQALLVITDDLDAILENYYAVSNLSLIHI